MSRAENLISLAADKVTVKLIYQHLINPGDSAYCHAVQKLRPFFNSHQHHHFIPLNFVLHIISGSKLYFIQCPGKALSGRFNVPVLQSSAI